VIGTTGTPEEEEEAKKQGAHFVVNHRKEGYLDAIPKITDGKGVNVIIEMLASKNLEKDIEIAKTHGIIVVIGSRGKIAIDPLAMALKGLGIRGLFLNVGLVVSESQANEIYAGINAGLESGYLNPIIMKSFPLKDAPKAHEEIINPPKGATGKIVLHPWE